MPQAAVAPVTLQRYQRPRNLAEALACLDTNPQMQIVCGGTDWYAARVGRPVDFPMLDIHAISELRTIEVSAQEIRLGAGVSWAELQRRSLPAHLASLVQAAREVGGWQVQHRASLGGNLCNASPAADGVVPLLALDAQVELQSVGGVRRLPLSEFITAPRTTVRAHNELLIAIVVPQQERASSTFLKLGSRTYLVISLVMIAVLIRLDHADTIEHCAIAVGACAPVATRLSALERAIQGCKASDVVSWLHREVANPMWWNPLHPIDDVRATARYRLDAAQVAVVRSFETLLGT